MNEQSRINAMISYLFLGPLFLLAKKGTPLADPYVRSHTIRSSIILWLALIVYIVYITFLKSWLDFSILGFHIHTIILSLFSFSLIIILLEWAYKAYRGIAWENSVWFNIESFSTSQIHTPITTEEDKIRMIGSLIPFLGIYIASRYKEAHIERGRIIGSTLGCLLIIASIISGEGSSLMTSTIIFSILVFVVISVNIFFRSIFIRYTFLEYIPCYTEIEAHLFACLMSVKEFIRIIFGGSERIVYRIYFEKYIQWASPRAPETRYFMPASLIGMPFWNLFCIPSLWITQYREYREYIFSWILVTLGIGACLLIGGSMYSLIIVFLFPIVHMLSYADRDIGGYIPGTHLITRWTQWNTPLSKTRDNEEKISEEIRYTYDIPTGKIDSL
jgi:hypothetical protein